MAQRTFTYICGQVPRSFVQTVITKVNFALVTSKLLEY
jgi:hypothetical protein